MVAEHLDHLHYLNDILCLNITDLNHVLSNHLLQKLLIPLYIYSLTGTKKSDPLSKVLSQKLTLSDSPFGPQEVCSGKVSCVVALFLLSQVFLIISHSPLVRTLAWIILKTDRKIFDKTIDNLLESYHNEMGSHAQDEAEESVQEHSQNCDKVEQKNITDEEKQRLAVNPGEVEVVEKPFLETVYNAIDCAENDYAALFGLSLLYAMAFNKGESKWVINNSSRDVTCRKTLS